MVSGKIFVILKIQPLTKPNPLIMIGISKYFFVKVPEKCIQPNARKERKIPNRKGRTGKL